MNRDRRILLVEGDDKRRESLARQLQDEWEVTAVGDAAEALHEIVARRPDLLIAELLPGPGPDLLERLRAQADTRELPVLVLTGSAEEEQRLSRLRDQAVRMIDRVRAEHDVAGSARAALAPGHARHVADQAPVMLWASGPDRRCTWVNECCLAFTGASAEEELGFGWADRIHPEDREAALAALDAAFASRQPFELEYRVRRADGQYRWLVDRGRPRLEPGFAGYVGCAIDIDDKRRAERANALLSEASRVLSASRDAQAGLDAVLRLVVPDVADAAAFHVSGLGGVARCAAVLGRDDALHSALERELRERPLPITATHGHPAVVRSGQGDLVQGSGLDPQAAAALRPGLGMHTALSAPLSAWGRTVGALTVWLREPGRELPPADVALVEELARRAAIAMESARLYAEAQQASRLKDEFLSTVSHELRTPLNAILGWSHVLQHEAVGNAGSVSPTAKRAAEIIDRNARAQAQLVSDILDASRMVTGRLRLSPEEVDARQPLQAALLTAQAPAAAKDIRLEVDLPESGQVWADAARVQQVAWSLLSNALKFSPRGGVVTVSLRGSESEVAIRVADRGTGIAPEFLPHLFERFRLGDASTTRTQGGLGLGLAISRHLVDMHGGSIEARNRMDGPGAEVTVILPRRALASAEPAEGPTPAAGLRVVLWDGDPGSRERLAAALDAAGATVLLPVAEADILAELKSGRVDVVVADAVDRSGWELVKAMRALPAGAGGLTPAVALTGGGPLPDHTALMRAGFQDHLPRPVDIDAAMRLLAAIARTRSDA